MHETNRRYVLAKRPEGVPDKETFELEETEIPELETGQVLVQTVYLSVDPYMRDRMRAGESYAEPWDVGDPMQAAVVGRVVDSETDQWDDGDYVTGELDWAEYTVTDSSALHPVDPDLAPLSTYLGVLGMPGRTAYFGLLEEGKPTPGDTVVVSGAAGAVGSTVVQIASIAGCRVVGFAGSDTKVEYLEEIGADAAINYKQTDDYRAALDDAAPEGVDVYFDNVGGPITDAVFTKLNTDARVAVCGQIAHYNEEGVVTGPRKLPQLLPVRATVSGFIVSDYAPRFEQATQRLGEWVATGDITYRETVTEGLESAPDAFLGLFEGENIGKQLVKVTDE
ncbi:NADP-dependent oxidoreductase [Halocatena pleomorpha]|uniref:NADP-dependent oxidoreductase n=1 Tax=Halocatena pleomorpha TaxID=1785090 RepID=A0A3P3R6E1_9EURY|nr:NADP-dependent oxidoreductase [Halocatena pleomorpha]RRJ28143.1 NADP-dependent oxidoreductase [Halocatena pleomorpha]